MAKHNFGFTPQPAMRLSRILQVLAQTRVIEPVPSRPTLIRLIEQGTLKARLVGNAYLVETKSFNDWVKSFHPEEYDLIAPTVPPPPDQSLKS